MATRILFRTGTRAQIQAKITAEGFRRREPWHESDGGRMGVGNTGPILALKALDTIALSTAGDTTLGLLSWATRHTGIVTVAAGAGAYTRNIILPNAVTGVDGVTSVAFAAGDEVELRLEVAASANPTVRIWHNVASGTALVQLTGEASTARNYIVTLRHNGTQWVVWDVRQVNA